MAQWGVIWERERDGGKRRFVLDFGRYGKIYSHKGVRLESREQAQALLDTIRILAQEIGKQHAVDRFAPMASKRNRIGPWLERWLSDFEQQVKAGERAPRTLREYRRWAEAQYPTESAGDPFHVSRDSCSTRSGGSRNRRRS